jgi:hypothetical protein
LQCLPHRRIPTVSFIQKNPAVKPTTQLVDTFIDGTLLVGEEKAKKQPRQQ